MVSLKMNGFDDLVAKLQKAGGDVDGAMRECAERGGDILQSELKTAMKNADETGEMSRLISRMPPPSSETKGGTITVRAGYEKGPYDPENISDGYKVAFINYGTPRRSKHGKVRPRGFIQKAKKKAKPKILAESEKIFDRLINEVK